MHDAQVQAVLKLLEPLAEGDVLPGRVPVDEEERASVAAVGERPEHAHDRGDPRAAPDKDVPRSLVPVDAELSVGAVEVR